MNDHTINGAPRNLQHFSHLRWLRIDQRLLVDDRYASQHLAPLGIQSQHADPRLADMLPRSLERLEITECGPWPVESPNGFASGIMSVIEVKAEGELAHLSSIGFDGMALSWVRDDPRAGIFERIEHMSLRPIDAFISPQRSVLHKLYRLAEGAGITLEMLDCELCIEHTEEQLDPFGLEDTTDSGYV